MEKIGVVSLGCPKNAGEYLPGDLVAVGYEITPVQ